MDKYQTDKSHASRSVLWLTLIILIIFFVWAYYAEIDEITRAPGTVIASSRTQLIQSQDGGTLEQLMVREGDVVQAGDILAKIDRTRSEAAYLETRARVAGLTASLARLRAEITGASPVFPKMLDDYPELVSTQLALLRQRRLGLEQEISSLVEIRELASEELDMNLPLLSSGDVSRTDILRLQREVAQLNSEIINTRNSYLREVEAELATVIEELAGSEQTLAQRRSVLDHTHLVAPMSGVVKNVAISTVGGVIKQGEDIMEIVPLEDDLLIEAKINPGNIAFLNIGDEASVKIDAYDFTIFGDLPGELIFISADTMTENLNNNEEPYYRARVRTMGKYFSAMPEKELDIQPGMTAMVEIKTGSRTVLSYLAKPLVKTLSESMGER